MPKKQVATEPSFEQRLERIQEVVGLLESGSLSLQDSLLLFEEGITLVRGCQEQLQQAEFKVEMLIAGSSGQKQSQLSLLPEEE